MTRDPNALACAGAMMSAVSFEGHYGSWHRPAPGAALGVTVLLCPPVGGEGRRAYRPIWLLAERLARRGYDVLRYDPLGEGDSLPLPADADQWAAWREGVEQAAAFSRRVSGGQPLVLGGLRLGASLAACAAAAVRPQGLMLLAPVAAGRTWLREMQLAGRVVEAPGGALEIDGLWLSAKGAAALKAFKLPSLGEAAEAMFCAAPRPEAVSAPSAGQVEVTGFPDFAELFQEAHVNSPPLALFERVEAWLDSVDWGGRPGPVVLPSAELVTSAWRETAVTLPGGARAILTLPAEGAPSRGAVFGNTGADPRAGIGGFAAGSARALAAGGAAALRLDFIGIGESPADADWRSHVFETARGRELSEAVDLLAAQGCEEVVLSGVCSAAYHALAAAEADPRVSGVVVFNPRFAWTPGARLMGDPAAVRPVRLRALTRATAWRRLLTGKLALREIVQRVAGTVARRLGAVFGPRLTADARIVRARASRFLARGGRLHVLVGEDDEYWDEMEANFGRGAGWLRRQRGASVRVSAGIDHGLFSTASRATARAELLSRLGASAPAREARPRMTLPMAVAQGAQSLALSPVFLFLSAA